MAQFIKAYNEGSDTVFELSVVAANSRVAETRALANLFIRNPGEITALKDTDVLVMGRGIMKEHRVIITVSDGESVRDIIGMNRAARALERLL